jgi:hypothetical protein
MPLQLHLFKICSLRWRQILRMMQVSIQRQAQLQLLYLTDVRDLKWENMYIIKI